MRWRQTQTSNKEMTVGTRFVTVAQCPVGQALTYDTRRDY